MQPGGTIPSRFRGWARRDAVAFYLTQLARAVLAGEVTVVSGDRATTLATSDPLALEIDVKHKKRASVAVVRVRWAKRPLIKAGGSDPGAGQHADPRLSAHKGSDPTGELEFCGPATPVEAAEALARLAEGIRAGGLSVSLGEDEIAVLPAGDLSLEIDASERKGKGELEVVVTWRSGKGLHSLSLPGRGSG
jgi:amphi-Trp domain-containing protein